MWFGHVTSTGVNRLPTGSSAIRTSEGNKKHVKKPKEVGGQCEGRPTGTRNELEESGGQHQEQENLKKSS